MAEELRIGLSELLRKAIIEHDTDFLKEGVRVLSQALMELEVEEHLGPGRHERSAGRTGQSQRLPGEELGHPGGHRRTEGPQGERLELLPFAFGAPRRRRAERALWAVVHEAYVHGVSTRKVDDLWSRLWG